MNAARTIFFGSTGDSVLVLASLANDPIITLVAVVTQPVRPVGRKQILTPTPVEVWAKKTNIPVLSFPTKTDKPWEYEDEQTVIDTLQPLKADLLVSASYGQMIPSSTIKDAKHGGLNVHPSILPRWRGADPVPWAILSGDQQTGVTIVRLSSAKFDVGLIIAQKKIPVTGAETTVLLRETLFNVGAKLLIESLPDFLSGKNNGTAQKIEDEPYAKRLTRDDGFETWEVIQKALDNPDEAVRIDRKFRALTPWPGLWTKVGEKRLKILEAGLKHGMLTITTVQLEGKTPVPWEQFVSAYLP